MRLGRRRREIRKATAKMSDSLPQKVRLFEPKGRTFNAWQQAIYKAIGKGAKTLAIMTLYNKVQRNFSDKWYVSAVIIVKPVTADEAADTSAG